jgi:NarL family two-component system response regulator YdfI
MIQVVIIASTQAVRAGLRALLEPDSDITVIGEVTSLIEATRSSLEVDAWLYSASNHEGAAALAVLEEERPGAEPYPALLLMTDDPQATSRLANLTLRVWGVVALDASGEDLSAALHALNAGLLVGAPHLMEALLPQPSRFNSLEAISDPTQSFAEVLTPRETEILQLVAQGLANKQIAGALNISEHTVKFHVSAIYSKLGVMNRPEAVRVGARRGLITL